MKKKTLAYLTKIDHKNVYMQDCEIRSSIYTPSNPYQLAYTILLTKKGYENQCFNKKNENQCFNKKQ